LPRHNVDLLVHKLEPVDLFVGFRVQGSGFRVQGLGVDLLVHKLEPVDLFCRVWGTVTP